MENNYYPNQDVEETGPDNEFLELVLTVGKNFQSWDKTLNFFTEYCHQKGFHIVNIIPKLLKFLQV